MRADKKRKSIVEAGTLATPGFANIAVDDQRRTPRALSWLTIAKRHAAAGRLLTQNEFWPEGVFQLQQAVEKLVRAIAVETGIVSAQDIRQTGHDSLRVFELLFEGYEAQAAQVEQLTLSHPSLARARMTQWKHFTKYRYSSPFIRRIRELRQQTGADLPSDLLEACIKEIERGPRLPSPKRLRQRYDDTVDRLLQWERHLMHHRPVPFHRDTELKRGALVSVTIAPYLSFLEDACFGLARIAYKTDELSRYGNDLQRPDEIFDSKHPLVTHLVPLFGCIELCAQHFLEMLRLGGDPPPFPLIIDP